MNTVNLTGRLANTPKKTIAQNGKVKATFILALSDTLQPKESYFIPMICGDARAEFLCKYLEKGSVINVVGRLVRRSYKDENLQTHYVMEVVVDSICPFKIHTVTQEQAEQQQAQPMINNPVDLNDVLPQTQPVSQEGLNSQPTYNQTFKETQQNTQEPKQEKSSGEDIEW